MARVQAPRSVVLAQKQLQRAPRTHRRVQSAGFRVATRNLRVVTPRCASEDEAKPSPGLNEAQVGQLLQKGDLVVLSYRAFTEDGNKLEEDDDLSLELGSGDVVGNPLFKVRYEALSTPPGPFA